MDDQLKKALEFSNYRQTLSIQRKLLKEKLESGLTFGHNGGIFYIDRSLISFVQLCINEGRTSGIPLIDINDNPILVDDLIKFKEEIFDRYFTANFEYLNEFNKLKKSRSVEKLVDL